MLIDKEYPATHSMSTAWYIVDEDGNVGIVDFEDDGPVPFGTPNERCIFQVVVGDLYSEVGSIDLEDDQILPLLGYEDDSFSDTECFVKIDTNRKEDFLKILQSGDLRLVKIVSENLGLYVLDETELFSQTIDQLENEKIILKYYKINDCYQYHPYKGTLVNEHFDEWPYYMYGTNDSRFEPLFRYMVPPKPVHISQLSKELRERVLKIPVKFSETEQFQILDWYPGFFYSIEKEEIKINNFRYAMHFDQNNHKCYYLCGFWDINWCTQGIKFLNWRPTVAVWCHEHIDFDYSNFYNEIYSNKAVLFDGSLEKIPNEEIIDFFKPNVIIVEIEAMDNFESIHKIEKHKTTINGTEYPVYYDAEIDEFKDEILALSNMPYRGPVAPLKISYKEGQKILRHKKQN